MWPRGDSDSSFPCVLGDHFDFPPLFPRRHWDTSSHDVKNGILTIPSLVSKTRLCQLLTLCLKRDIDNCFLCVQDDVVTIASLGIQQITPGDPRNEELFKLSARIDQLTTNQLQALARNLKELRDYERNTQEKVIELDSLVRGTVDKRLTSLETLDWKGEQLSSYHSTHPSIHPSVHPIIHHPYINSCIHALIYSSIIPINHSPLYLSSVCLSTSQSSCVSVLF